MKIELSHTRILAATAISLALVANVGFAQSKLAVPPAGPSAVAAAEVDPELTPMYDAIERYLALQRRLRQEVPPLAPGAAAAELNAIPETLARAIERARPNARPGDFFSARPSRAIKQRMGGVLEDPAIVAVLANIDDEPPLVREPKIYLRFPAGNQMARMPASLLAVLPGLPAELEYRIVGSYLVLRDTNSTLIIDYIPQAVPRR